MTPPLEGDSSDNFSTLHGSLLHVVVHESSDGIVGRLADHFKVHADDDVGVCSQPSYVGLPVLLTVAFV